MSSNESIIDENNLLTETGKKVLKSGLQDEIESLRLFDMIRNSYKESIGNMNNVVNQFPNNDHYTYEELEKTVTEITKLLMNAITKIYTDISFMFDTFEIVNSNHLENRKTIRDLAEALTKNKNTNDAVFRDIFEKIEKNDEKNEHISKLTRENMEKIVLAFSQDHKIVKHVKRNLEDKAKVVDGNE